MSIWNGAFEAIPLGGSKPSLGPSVMRTLKKAIRERFMKEHTQDLASGLESEDGFHRRGSAVSYFQSLAPTTRPDGVTALDSNDNGRLWVTDSETPELFIYKHPDWVSPFGVMDATLAAAEADLATAVTGTFSVLKQNAGLSVGAEVTLPALEVNEGRFLIIYGKKGGSTQTVSFLVPSEHTYRFGLISVASGTSPSVPVSAVNMLLSGDGEVVGPNVAFARTFNANYYFAVRVLVTRVA